jgi:hypothetical protein
MDVIDTSQSCDVICVNTAGVKKGRQRGVCMLMMGVCGASAIEHLDVKQ